MMSKKALLALSIPLSFSSAFAKVQMIPKAEQIVKEAKNFGPRLVLKNAKGTLLDKMMNTAPENWFNLSPSDGAEGVRTEEAYLTFGLPQSEDIIVAVIDSGVDVNHEDLQGKIWINSGEIADNGKDDDLNGYTDDVFGWNFIGGGKGMAKIEVDRSLKNGIRLVKGDPSAQVNSDTLEVTRELVRMKKLKTRVEELGESLTPTQAEYLDKVQKIVTENLDNAKNVLSSYGLRLETYKAAEAILKAAGLKEITIETVRDLVSIDATVIQARKDMLTLLSNGLTLDRLNQVLEYYGGMANYYYNENFDPRSIVDDEFKPTKYGNNDVIGPDSSHGTHVAGSIAAARDNKLGIKGVATNVKIMAIRVVPNGDERDKDVANAIHYAVRNGAKIINMSFGKAFSPTKKLVDEAVRYAESKGVLLVHAAGNDNKDNDLIPSFPSRNDLKTGLNFQNWLEIGASSFEKGLSLPADFSNYGKKSVDFFAPGVDILSTTPDNTYDTFSGTSMASPTAAGVAAMVLSYAPDMDPVAVKQLMIDTSRRYPKLKVNVPGTETQVLFSSLSRTGTIVDAFEAILSTK